MPWSSQTLDRLDLNNHPRRRPLVILLPMAYAGMFISPSVLAAPGYTTIKLKLSTLWTIPLCTLSALLLIGFLAGTLVEFRAIRQARGTNDIDSLCYFFGTLFNIAAVSFLLAYSP